MTSVSACTPASVPSFGPGRVELGRARDHRPVAGVVELALLERGAVDADAERLAEHQLVAGLRAGVALEVARIDEADRDQAVDRLDGIDGVAAGDRDAGARADRLAAFEDPADRLERQLVHRHADERQREERLPAHRVHVGDGVGRGDRAEVERIVDDRHEEVGGGDDRLRVVDLVDRGVVAVSMPTSSSFGTRPGAVLARICSSTPGAILQPQPPPWLNWVSRTCMSIG